MFIQIAQLLVTFLLIDSIFTIDSCRVLLLQVSLALDEAATVRRELILVRLGVVFVTGGAPVGSA